MATIPIPSGLQTKLCIIGEDVISEIPRFIRETWSDHVGPVRIVADDNTWKVAGSRLQALLVSSGISVDDPYVFPANPPFHAEYSLVEALREPLKGHLPIAVGSGTINDLVKRTTFELGLNGYLCCATAPSVDGYTSAGAAISIDNFKQTLECPAPLVIVAETGVLSTAPFDMTAAGYADLAAKVPAGGDWFIADALGITPFDSIAWRMVQTDLREWLANPEWLKDGNSDSLAKLFNGLCQTGFAMQHMKDSRPASGAEHLYSHCWEMRDIRKDGSQPSHGFKVAVGSLITTALMEEVYFGLSTAELKKMVDAAPILTECIRNSQVTEFLGGTPFEDNARKVSMMKLPRADEAVARRNLLIDTHDSLADKLRVQLLSFDELKRRFSLLGCPVSFEEIGLTRDDLRYTTYAAGMIRNRYTISTYAAGMIRNRYTILDVLTDLGITDEICERAMRRF